MNETRKQIIELIEPYMDKTKSFWCIIKWESTWEYWIIERMAFDTWMDFYAIWNKHELCLSHCIIIWHYDITAVLKYIKRSKKVIYMYDDWDDYFFFEIKEKNADWDNKVIKAPFKPLHLYSEQEEKDLLKLLLKLK